MAINRNVGRAAKAILTLIILYFVYRQVAGNWDAIRSYQWEPHWLSLVASVLVGLFTFVLLAALWREIISGFGHRLTLGEAYRIFYLSNLGRYVPGKVWQLFGILYLARQKGIPATQATASFVAVQLFAIPSSFLLFAAALWLVPELRAEAEQEIPASLISAFFVAMVVLSLGIVLFPEKLFAVGDWILKKFKKDGLPFRMSRGRALGIYVGYVGAWAVFGLAFWLFVRGVAGPSGLSLATAIGAFNGAYQVGYLALFAPGGLGPREFILTILLAPFLGAITPAVAVLARLWSLAVEGIAAVIALLVGK